MATDFSTDPLTPLEGDIPRTSRTWLEAFKRQLLREDDAESDTDERIEHIERSRICLRPQIRTFEDVRAAAEGLRGGVPQIINLTEAPPEIAQRLLDFLQGVIYIIHGCQTYISPTIFLFTPGSVEIEHGDGLSISRSGSGVPYDFDRGV